MTTTEPNRSPRTDADLRAMYPAKGFHTRREWRDAPAVLIDGKLTILGHPVMQNWEIPYMAELARIVTSRGGKILEIGYGMGISAGLIQKAEIESHLIIEANRDVAKNARRFAQTARHPTRVIEGFWEDVLPTLPATELFDGILHDAYPMDEAEIMNQVRCAPTAFQRLKPGGILTYFSDEATDYTPDHLGALVQAGFPLANIDHTIVKVDPPSTCDYWKDPTILAPIITKPTDTSTNTASIF